MEYTRRDLLVIGAQFVTFLRYDPKDVDKPIRVMKSDTDEQVEVKLVEALTAANAAGWIGKDSAPCDLSEAPDELLNFINEHGIITFEEDDDEQEDLSEPGEMQEEDEQEETVEDELPLDADSEAGGDVQPETGDDLDADLDAELAAAEKELQEAEQQQQPVKSPTEAIVQPAPKKQEPPEMDDKIQALAKDHNEIDPADVFAQYAPVTIQNVEAGVLAIAALLKAGKVVVISAHEIGSVPIPGHTEKSVNVNTGGKSAGGVPTVEEFVEKAVADGMALLEERFNSDLKLIQAKRAFCKDNKIAIPDGKDGGRATAKQVESAIRMWKRKSLTKEARATYAAELAG